jgi:hypothetical protein
MDTNTHEGPFGPPRVFLHRRSPRPQSFTMGENPGTARTSLRGLWDTPLINRSTSRGFFRARARKVETVARSGSQSRFQNLRTYTLETERCVFESRTSTSMSTIWLRLCHLVTLLCNRRSAPPSLASLPSVKIIFGNLEYLLRNRSARKTGCGTSVLSHK